MAAKVETSYLDKPSLWVIILTTILILVIVTGGVLVKIFADEYTSRIVLVSLIVLLSILGFSAVGYLELRKYRVKKKEKTTVKNGRVYMNIEPSAPKDPQWEYSNRETLPSA